MVYIQAIAAQSFYGGRINDEDQYRFDSLTDGVVCGPDAGFPISVD
jgi:hypothetical protein